MKKIVQKLSSRKLWTALAGVVMGLCMAFGLDEGSIGTVSGAVVSIVSVITYIVTEGRIDAAAVGNAVKDTQNAIQAIGNSDAGNKPE